METKKYVKVPRWGCGRTYYDLVAAGCYPGAVAPPTHNKRYNHLVLIYKMFVVMNLLGCWCTRIPCDQFWRLTKMKMLEVSFFLILREVGDRVWVSSNWNSSKSSSSGEGDCEIFKGELPFELAPFLPKIWMKIIMKWIISNKTICFMIIFINILCTVALVWF